MDSWLSEKMQRAGNTRSAFLPGTTGLLCIWGWALCRGSLVLIRSLEESTLPKIRITLEAHSMTQKMFLK